MTRDSDDRRPLDLAPAGGGEALTDRRLRQATAAFVALGVALRVARYLMNYPLWWDEAFVAVNFLRRGYLDLLRPLDYGQVCPILFLWAELTAVKLLGVSEWSLRLVPLACAVAGVFLFRVAAGLVLRGVPLLLAVAVFAVSFHPVRHAADLKPYAGDLLAALVLLTSALAWWRSPGRAAWLWALAAAAPVALAGSHPAVFVAGGVGLGLAPAVVRSGSRGVRVAYSAFLLATAATFLGLFVVFTGAQASATLGTMRAQWGQGFPPRNDPTGLARWLVSVHTGGMFAYPCGGEHGASAATLALFAAGAVVLVRRGRGTVAGVCLAPFGVALAAAALRRYPYGGVAHGTCARIMQYLVPSVCLLTGLGAAALVARISRPRLRFRVLRLGLFALVLVGVVPVAADATHPYRSAHAWHARRFARDFWPAVGRGAEPVCLRWDLGLGAWDSLNLNVAVYLCNQAIYSPRRRQGQDPRPEGASDGRPLRCVLSLSDPDDARVIALLDGARAGYRLKRRRVRDVNMADPGARRRVERYVVYDFVPVARGVAARAGASPAVTH